MRVVTVRVGGKVIDMPPTWNAIKRVAQRVRCPWELAHAAAVNGGALLFDAQAAAAILHIGVTEAGHDEITEDDCGEEILRMGMNEAAKKLGDYLTALVEGGPERPVAGADSKKK